MSVLHREYAAIGVHRTFDFDAVNSNENGPEVVVELPQLLPKSDQDA